jgi:hypothetical protein
MEGRPAKGFCPHKPSPSPVAGDFRSSMPEEPASQELQVTLFLFPEFDFNSSALRAIHLNLVSLRTKGR